MNSLDSHLHDGLCVGHDWRQCHPRVSWDPESHEATIRRRLKQTQSERPEWKEEVK
jgi:hypothetical protein